MVTGNRGPVLEAEFGTRGDAEHCDAPTLVEGVPAHPQVLRTRFNLLNEFTPHHLYFKWFLDNKAAVC